ncbi:DJ-1/PfpI family protein [Runella slithyformis]|uniref:ThiJ/PfpI domain-containing protein n=1 Tax=Runella slithyformis (strain ATCC 29530 / DSM 19594 / LMG 11500 / NCIMB 11436 / LSU 4) TaxID=761193 RepID=A0A7U3ZQI7_RUNSL|nr:DJ-1/PfpI family protein [Runella slithyformis]AEI51535.1 ThiJ/PfpI domain-containing protein [Runella slithyformis DSM 19594]
MTRNVAIFLFDEVEVLDFAGPYEVFSVTGLRTLAEKPFHVYTVAEKSPIRARNGLTVLPDYLLDNCPKPDIILIPGGGGFSAEGVPFGSRREMYNSVVLEWVRKHASRVELVLSVCTGALILGNAGLLEGLKATTHFKALDGLRAISPGIDVVEGVRYVDNGRVILSAGVSAGIDMSYYVVSKLLGKDTADEAARYAQYDYWR